MEEARGHHIACGTSGCGPLGMGQVEDWEVVDGSLENVENVLWAVSSHLPDKVAWTAAGMEVWRGGRADFPHCLEGKYGLCPTQCHTSAQCAETLERTIATYVDKNPVAVKNSASLTVMVMLNVMRLCVSTSQ